jgi:hypothetical protein
MDGGYGPAVQNGGLRYHRERRFPKYRMNTCIKYLMLLIETEEVIRRISPQRLIWLTLSQHRAQYFCLSLPTKTRGLCNLTKLSIHVNRVFSGTIPHYQPNFSRRACGTKLRMKRRARR